MINFKQNKSGAAMLFFVIFFTIASSALLFSLSRSLFGDLYTVSSLQSSKQAYITAESALEDRVFKMMDTGSFPQTSTSFSVMPGEANVKVNYNSTSDTYTVISTSTVGRTSKVSVVKLSPGAGTAFSYGLQSGNGGFVMRNGSSISGNVYSNGSVIGQGNSYIFGDVVSADPAGSVDGIETNTGSVRTNILKDSMIRGDAYYNTSQGGNTIIGGTLYSPLTPFPSTVPLPITDEEIEGWENAITDTYGCVGGEYFINSNTTIGNKIINCNLRIKKSGSGTTVILNGPIWVKGNIILEGGPTIKVDSGVGLRSVQMIADNPVNRLTSSKIEIQNGTTFEGSGEDSSFIVMVSQNKSAEQGGTETAISIGQSSSGKLVLYSGHGLIGIGNSISLKSVTGYKIDVGQSSNVTYDTGLTSIFFTGGPGGGYVISDWYQE